MPIQNKPVVKIAPNNPVFDLPVIVGIEGRLLPLFGWLWGFADRDRASTPPSLHAVPVRAVQAGIFYLWTAGVPLLAGGLAQDRPVLVAVGAGALCAAVAANAAHAALVLRRVWRHGHDPLR